MQGQISPSLAHLSGAWHIYLSSECGEKRNDPQSFLSFQRAQRAVQAQMQNLQLFIWQRFVSRVSQPL